MRITGVNRLNTSSLPERINLRHQSDKANLDYHEDNSSDSISPSTISSSDLSRNSSFPWSPRSSASSSSSLEYKPKHGPIGSLFMEEGHIYSIAAAGDLLFTGSQSTNVRVWKNLRDFSGFNSTSGMVKAIVVLGQKIFTGHQDGKIRVWAFSNDKSRNYNRIGNFPRTQDYLVNSMNPRNYVRVRSEKRVPWLKHYDTVSCMSVDADQGLLYSGSWDKTVKVWRISDSKCLESIPAHDDAVNSVVTASDPEWLVLTGSADGTVKAWRRTFAGNRTKHLALGTLLKQEHAVTALAVSHVAGIAYAGSSDGLVTFWDVKKWMTACGGVLRGHYKMAVLCLAVAGNLVLSGSADKSICVWRRDGGGAHACVAVLTGHCAPVKCLAVENDTSTAEEGTPPRWIVYSGSLDKSVKIWRVSE